jgi:para-nitrobenzyl esterase
MKSIDRTNSATRFRTTLQLIQCLLAICAFGSVRVSTASAAPAIVTDTGPLKGIETATTNQYLGIPYAVPPVGDLRWMPPVPHGKWHGVFQANQFGNVCVQPGGGGTIGSEDCLTLNIYTPSGKKNQNKHHGLPVMVWIHGGALVTGGGAVYDSTRLVEQGGVVVVTINYRLGFLGFFAHPAIDAEGHLNGNYGFMDQQLALQWVQRNISAFGGDPSRVTIFGESAGGQSVYSNLASPTAAGLFSRAIAESGTYDQFQDYWDPVTIVLLAQAETFGTPFVSGGTAIAASVGCSSGSPSQMAACLRGVLASTIIEQEPTLVFPFIDGTILTQTLSAAFASGDFNQVPVITGTNHDEYRLFVPNGLMTEADYEAAVDALWGGFGAGFPPLIFGVLYPLINYPAVPPYTNPSPGIALGASGTDGVFACPEHNAALLLSKFVPTYAYEFNDENAPFLFQPFFNFPFGAYHTAELQYLFDGDFFGFGIAPLSPAQEQLSEAMISYWTTFAANGDPNSAGQPLWSPYSSATDQFQSLIPPMPMVEPGFSFDSDHLCSSFWSAF